MIYQTYSSHYSLKFKIIIFNINSRINFKFNLRMTFEYILWCRERDSNPHSIATGGF